MPRSIKKSFESLAPMFRPPFDGLGWLVVLYFAWCFLMYPHSQTLRGNLPDPDDYMYLTQVLDWLKGQGWYDNVQHRLNPPDGVPIHFSRLAQMPMALGILMFEQLHLGPRAAAMLTAMIYPLILFGGMLVALRRLAVSYVPEKWAGVVAYIALFATAMTFMYTPGHLDHHGLNLMLITLVLGFVVRMVERPGDYRLGLAAGLIMALSLTVALEVLPWLLLISAFLGLWAVVKGGAAARNALVYALALYLGSMATLAITRPPSEWMVPDVLTYSCVYVYLTGGVAVSMAGIAAVAGAPALVRWVAGGALAALTGWAFLHSFPALVAGPYGGMDPELARMMLGELDEARPLIRSEDTIFGLAVHFTGWAVATAAASHFFRRAKGEARWRWALLLLLLTAGFLLTVFYQYRFIAMTSALTIVPLAALLQRGWARLAKWETGRARTFAEIGLLLLVGPLPGVLIPAAVDGRSFSSGVLLFPVDAAVKRNPCDTYVLEHVLDDPLLYGNRPRLIVSSMGQGPELLFRTPHKVLSAPYHMDVSGNIDATRFFSTPYASEAEQIARRRKIELVAACRYVPDVYTRPPEGKPGTLTGGAGKDFAPHFIELLMTGRAPKWLKEVDFRGLSNFVIYEVRLPDER
ncbi:MAG TPA: hypothetical protein VFR09_08840 [Alphaproteobacteria bacterium]|nr:hypothetical protein [Alphaproteobacteria bacterium]